MDSQTRLSPAGKGKGKKRKKTTHPYFQFILKIKFSVLARYFEGKHQSSMLLQYQRIKKGCLMIKVMIICPSSAPRGL